MESCECLKLGTAWIRPPNNLVIQIACYAPIENKANFLNISEQIVHIFCVDLPKHYKLYI